MRNIRNIRNIRNMRNIRNIRNIRIKRLRRLIRMTCADMHVSSQKPGTSDDNCISSTAAHGFYFTNKALVCE